MTINVLGKQTSGRNIRLLRTTGTHGPNDISLNYHIAAPLDWGWAYPAAFPAFDKAGGTTASPPAGRHYSTRHASGQPPAPLGGRRKRLVDMLVALCALVLASPLMLIVALLIKATAGGPAVYSHVRVGFHGKPFRCYKFRTMVANSEEVLREHLARDPEAARQWQEKRKLQHDPRITPLGMLLRKSSIDELPQLFNVLKGEMSCVGPRPVVADELCRYRSFVGDYLSARPGLTGLWQVTGRSNTDYSSRVALDSRYVRNWSLSTDFVILFRTIFAVIRFDDAA